VRAVIIADTEQVDDGSWRWLLIDLETGERVLTGAQTYSCHGAAARNGDRQRLALNHTPVIDTTTEDPFL